MTVPLLDLKAQNGALEDALVDAFRRVLRGGQYILGPEMDRFEAETAALLEVPHALGVSSGTDAILLALMALGIGPGDEVILPSFTFFATAGCVARLGAVPVFADVCPICFNLDAGDIAARITPRTRAVMPVHLFGQSADMDPVLRVAGEHGLRVIEDAAQAFGARYRGRPVGGLGDFGTYSFFPSKNLGTLGDAGLLVTRDDALADRARLLRLHGARPKYHHHVVGANFRMDALHAALLSVKLAQTPAYEAGRRANAADYEAQLSALPGVVVADPKACGCVASGGKSAEARLILPVAYPHNGHIWNQYTLRVPGPGRRDALRDWLAGRGIGTEIYYPIPLHNQVCFAPYRRGDLPVSERLAGEVLSLPVFPELAQAQRDEVVSAIAAFLEKGG
jgi:dTDP-4-amino-4,6-dideoxygalactose transaminase